MSPEAKAAYMKQWYAAHREERLQYMQEWYRKGDNKDRSRQRHRITERRRLYGLAEADYDNLLTAQGGVCAVCQEEMERPVIDHDHATGRVRGIVHQRCNVKIAWVEHGHAARIEAYLARSDHG